jgi:hypothetical protein
MELIDPNSSEAEGFQLSRTSHASLNPDLIPKNNVRHYRGPVPALSNVPDNMYVFYEQQGFRGQRTFQPTLEGSL